MPPVSTAAASARLRWSQLPNPVRDAAEAALRARVVRDEPQAGGFSPGLASRVVLADGRRVFAKAISADRNPRSPELYRREIEVMAALPSSLPAPGLRWSYDDGDWVMLVLDDVAGRMPAQPWERSELARVLTALEQLADLLTPAPIAAMSIVDDLADNFRSWRTLAADTELDQALDGWTRANLDRLVELESGWSDAARGVRAGAPGRPGRGERGPRGRRRGFPVPVAAAGAGERADVARASAGQGRGGAGLVAVADQVSGS